ncbi:MAG: nicotinamide mononucleotide transporter [Saprospiraceae bacterium]|nr:nicotinamide mononucleotide transporter [Saprospiraceae bacterium]
MNEVISVVVDYILTNRTELIAAFFGIVSVWYSRKNDVLVYPTGIVSVLLYVYICFNHKLYADAGINFYYFIMSVIGWINWTRKKVDEYVYPIAYCNKKEWIVGLSVFFISLFSLIYVLSHWTDSHTVLGDSLVSSSAVTAMWWMAKRKIENWYAWILSNVVALPLFFSKGLYPTVFQYIIFLILATWGLITWRKLYTQSQSQPTNANNIEIL